EQEIRTAQVRALYEQAPSAVTATIMNAVILATVLWKEIPHALLIGWLSAVVFVAAARYAQVKVYFRDDSTAGMSLRWGRRYLFGVAANGALWGFASFFFFTQNSYLHQVFLAFVLVGMVSGGVSTLAPIRGGYLLFLIPALLPYGVRLVTAGGKEHLAMTGMLIIYVAVMARIAHRLQSMVTESLRLRFENFDLLADLTWAKERQEIANHELAAQIAEKRAAQIELQKAYAELERRVQERTEKLAQSEEALRYADRRKDEFLAMLG